MSFVDKGDDIRINFKALKMSHQKQKNGGKKLKRNCSFSHKGSSNCNIFIFFMEPTHYFFPLLLLDTSPLNQLRQNKLISGL
jgi:hypothetical protein